MILDTVFRFSLAEKLGSGVSRIRDLVKARGLGVEFDVDGDFRTIFQRPMVGDNVLETLTAVSYEALSRELTDNELKILAFCAQAPLSSREISERLGHMRISGTDKKSLSNLITKKYLEYTKPGTPRITGQKYRTSEAVKRALEKTSGT